MAQITVYVDSETEQIVKEHVRASGESASKWVADAVRRKAATEWPPDVAKLFGSWADEDVPEAAELRSGQGSDVPRESL